MGTVVFLYEYEGAPLLTRHESINREYNYMIDV